LTQGSRLAIVAGIVHEGRRTGQQQFLEPTPHLSGAKHSVCFPTNTNSKPFGVTSTSDNA
jgi:hypothetical protein